MGPHPAVAAIRLAVRRALIDLAAEAAVPVPAAALRSTAVPVPAAALAAAAAPAATMSATPATVLIGNARRHPSGLPRTPAAPGSPLVLVAVSGGADSMALAAATAFEAPKLGLRVGAVTVDHGLQDGSADRARQVAERLRALGLDPVEAVPVLVGRQGGPEAAARDARYAALDEAAERHAALAVFLGHTRDDQAETVLLGLARGSGARSLAGMPAQKGRYRRPLLDLDRSATRQACAVQSIQVWDDPHNLDPAYTRARVRHEVLPVLEKHLGGGVVEALARTARLFRDDADALDQWALRAEQQLYRPEHGGLPVAALAELPAAVRRRVLRRVALRTGSRAGDLFARHLEAVDLLVTGWRGQGPLQLPGGVEVTRRCGNLVFRRQDD
ncbi:tRNA lysidine(34) synthetase TilS [Kitasatospora sp. NBC_01287]|uniref:tRNA lysidine(34) synthetase TilS n=1 Tax=Kitasatospora sp. NBC_01287 TaxID=2903573 RepID=UPI002256A937|nr:tRNA lysidine(34) synthetase TilS [Kitasatospora sp. NBC_01287]MCX4747381.1 tRNA lysidine(34) synthetase TilS [Kitasatospora sp. NBC_01287]